MPPISSARLPAARILTVAAAVSGILFAAGTSLGFDTTRHTVPLDRIVSGGPPKDGIPALTQPRLVEQAKATYLDGDDLVVGVSRGDVAKAYPLRILAWHEIVNDTLGTAAVAVTYCPLTGSAVVFDRTVGDEVLSFGVSGRLYESNVLMYDHQSESLWSQLGTAAVAGERSGTSLAELPAVVTTWRAWREAHPDTLVLSLETGHGRNYDLNPYSAYESSGGLMFRPSRTDARLPVKERVLGLLVDGHARAYPHAALDAAGGTIVDRVAGREVREVREVTVTSHDGGASARVDGEPVGAVSAYWFAWFAFHPETSVWSPNAEPSVDGRRLEDVAIVETRSYWTSLAGAVPSLPGDGALASDGRGGLFVISGTLRNVSDGSVDHVTLRFELVDAGGNVVHRQDGFNRAAEALVFADEPSVRIDQRIEPILPGATDSYRMIFIADEIPRFAHPTVSVLSVE